MTHRRHSLHRRRGAWRRWSLIALLVAAVGVGCGDDDAPSDPPVPEDPTTGEVSSELVAAQSCDQVTDHLAATLTEQALEQLYFSRSFDYDGDMNAGEPDVGDDGASPPQGGEGGESGESPSDYTDTNVQEAGVDEPDIIKTDGDHIYAIAGQSLQILKSWPPSETEVLATVPQGGDEFFQSLFLEGDRLAVFSRLHSSHRPQPMTDDGANTGEPGSSGPSPGEEPLFGGTRVQVFDVSNPAEPQALRTIEIEGQMVDGRMIDGQVYLATNSHLRHIDVWSILDAQNLDEQIPVPAWDEPVDDDDLDDMRQQARPQIYDAIHTYLSDQPAEDWLPRKRLAAADADLDVGVSPLMNCEDLYLPSVPAQLGFATLSSFDIDAADELDATSLLARGMDLYASQSNIYLTMSSRSWWWGPWGMGWSDPQHSESHIHKFSIDDGPVPQYRASGRVDGWILNQFSMSEYDGHLRVATTDNRWEWDPDMSEPEDAGGNHMIVLARDGAELVETGSVRNLAPTERVYSARFMGERGYVVTFREVDPFYTFDLSDPTDPQMLGELKIEGFSSYMHPLDDDHLLAIGRDGDDTGMMTGVHLQVFDVSDMSDPQRIHHETVSTGGWSSYSEAMWNHHAFTYQPRLGLLAVPMSIYDDGDHFSGLMVFDATVDGIEEFGRIDHSDLVIQAYCGDDPSSDCTQNYWWTHMRRSVMMSGDQDADEEYIYSLSEVGLMVHDLFDLDQGLASILFDDDTDSDPSP